MPVFRVRSCRSAAIPDPPEHPPLTSLRSFAPPYAEAKGAYTKSPLTLREGGIAPPPR